MGGIRNDYGKAFLNTLTCNTAEMYGSSQSSYLYIELQYTNSSSGASTTSLVNYSYTNIFENTVPCSYLGLLYQQPQYHMKDSCAHPALTLYNLETQETTSNKSFLEIREIPNRSHNDILKNVSGYDHYWPEYARAMLGKLEQNTETGKWNVVETAMTGAQLEVDYEITGSTTCKPITKLINKNSIGLFLGENTLSYDWPAIKYFGLFRNKNDDGNVYIYQDQNTLTKYYIETNPDLYFWGELQESSSWYHEYTGGSEEWAAKKDVLYELQSGVYVLTTDTTYDSSKTYYEKKGIIVKKDQGVSFSPEAFQLVFEDNCYEVD